VRGGQGFWAQLLRACFTHHQQAIQLSSLPMEAKLTATLTISATTRNG
jgi:hypothetical protein